MRRLVMAIALMVACLSSLAVVPALAQEGEQGSEIQQARNAELDFMLGEWTTVHEVPGRDGNSMIVEGEASIRRAVGGTFVHLEWKGTMEGRGDVFTLLMLNYSPAKGVFNCTLFDNFGGEPGIFHGDWVDESRLALRASFTEEDGSVSHQRFTFAKVDGDTFTLARAFSDDGETYHFEVTGTYTRR